MLALSPLRLHCSALQDLSSNGTFLNGTRLGRGQAALLCDGDRVSLVLSVAPLAEQAFVFKNGEAGVGLPTTQRVWERQLQHSPVLLVGRQASLCRRRHSKATWPLKAACHSKAALIDCLID